MKKKIKQDRKKEKNKEKREDQSDVTGRIKTVMEHCEREVLC